MSMKYDKVIRIPSYELEREMKREYDIEINIKKLMFSNKDHDCTCGRALCSYLYLDDKEYIKACEDKSKDGDIEFQYRYLVYTHLQKLFPKAKSVLIDIWLDLEETNKLIWNVGRNK